MAEYKTTFRKEKEERDMKFYLEYVELTSNPDNNKTVVLDALMQKYGVHGISTCYVIIRRVEKRLGKQQSIINNQN